MDPITAALNFGTELLRFLGKVVDGQPPEIKKQMWEEHMKTMAWVRRLLKIE